jgi:16S rRNA processing protein RimM
MSESKWVALAEIARPHGVWGEVRLKVYNSDSELLFSQSELLVRRPTGAERMMQVESIRGADAGYLIAKFVGIDDRDAADLLRGASVCVARERFPELEEGEFYVCDIIGAKVVGPAGELGVVADFVSYPSADVLVVATGTGGPNVEVPLVDDFVQEVDAGAGRIVLRGAAIEWLDGARAANKNHAN